MKYQNKKTESKPESKPEQKIDIVKALYVDKTEEQLEADEKIVAFFQWLLANRTVDELL